MVVAPNFLQSEIYYPREIWETDPTHRAYLEGHVPLGRLGRPEELGELVAFLASGKCDFVSGQVTPFAGGLAGYATISGRPARSIIGPPTSSSVQEFLRTDVH
jgi:NAD(P)-dependent dehydrogenase (short-subunit alcohol dehydrogenase family)